MIDRTKEAIDPTIQIPKDYKRDATIRSYFMGKIIRRSRRKKIITLKKKQSKSPKIFGNMMIIPSLSTDSNKICRLSPSDLKIFFQMQMSLIDFGLPSNLVKKSSFYKV
jgi:hypothetical protein